MVKKVPVSVNWQTLFILIPIVDWWASYRIQKFRLYFLIFYIGFGVGSGVLLYALFPETMSTENYPSLYAEGFWEVWLALTLGGYALAIILIRKWSREWNEKLQG